MNKELFIINFNMIKKAVTNNLELLATDKNSLQAVSAKEWNEHKNMKARESSYFLISKTIAYCVSVFEEDMQITNMISTMSSELTTYLMKRHMSYLAGFVKDFTSYQKGKSTSHIDFSSDRYGT